MPIAAVNVMTAKSISVGVKSIIGSATILDPVKAGVGVGELDGGTLILGLCKGFGEGVGDGLGEGEGVGEGGTWLITCKNAD